MSLRERINGDPKLQIGLGVVLVIIVAFILLHKGGGEEAEAVTEEPVAASVEGAPTEETALALGGESALTTFDLGTAGPALPKKISAAYGADKTVAVLFVHDGSVDDRLVKRYSKSVAGSESGSGFKLFVVPVKQIGRYASLTLALGVQRVPALIVLRRKSLSQGGAEGTVLYGYQAPARIRRTVQDASYKGPPGSYHPG